MLTAMKYETVYCRSLLHAAPMIFLLGYHVLVTKQITFYVVHGRIISDNLVGMLKSLT